MQLAGDLLRGTATPGQSAWRVASQCGACQKHAAHLRGLGHAAVRAQGGEAQRRPRRLQHPCDLHRQLPGGRQDQHRRRGACEHISTGSTGPPGNQMISAVHYGCGMAGRSVWCSGSRTTKSMSRSHLAKDAVMSLPQQQLIGFCGGATHHLQPPPPAARGCAPAPAAQMRASCRSPWPQCQ